MSNQVTDETLEQTPERVLPFLRAIATKVEIRSAMAGCGYTEAEQAHGWKLLLEVSGYSDSSFPVTDDQKARAAIAELDAWDEAGLRRIQAALARLHPEQNAFVFAGIEPGQGASSVVSVAMLLDRLDALEGSPERAATRDADKAALETLTKRGIDAAMRKSLRELVAIAQQAKPPVATTEPTDSSGRQEKLRELHAWFSDWSETARAVIHRRDYLMFMGLAKRSKRSKSESETVTPPVAPAVAAPEPAAPASPNNGSTGPVAVV